LATNRKLQIFAATFASGAASVARLSTGADGAQEVVRKADAIRRRDSAVRIFILWLDFFFQLAAILVRKRHEGQKSSGGKSTRSL